MNRKHFVYISILVALIVTSCSPFQKLLKSSDNELKYTKSMEYYEHGKYLKSLQLLDQIQPIYRGTDKSEKIAFAMANCYFKQKDYLMGGYYFKMFANNYSSSPNAEEAAYLSAYCSYLESPESTLDQSSSKEAIAMLQAFKMQYPNSVHLSDCNRLIAELQSKLETKAINIALLYYTMEDYKAAIYTFNNVLKDYPDSKYKEEILFRLLQSKYEFAYKSIIDKKQERVNDALNTYEDLIASFPNGNYTQKAKIIKKSLDKEIVK